MTEVVTIKHEDIEKHHPDKLMPAISRECAPMYWHAVSQGEQVAVDTDVTVVGLVRNSMPFIQINADRIHRLAQAFKNMRVYVYENDSEDGTDDFLRSWSADVEYVTVECVKHDRPQLSHEKSNSRTNALAEYRQRCADWAREHAAAGRHVVIALDFDTWGGWSHDGIMAGLWQLEQTPQAAGMASVSTIEMPVSNHPAGKMMIHYDAWAFRLNHWHEHAMPWFPYWLPPVGSDPLPCRSAFGGMCIYRPQAFFAGKYIGGDCEHVPFHRSIFNATGLRIYLNPSQRVVMNWMPEPADGWQHSNH